MNVLVTGSSKGLGKALAFAFANEGYDIVVHGRNREQLNEVSSSIAKKTNKICYAIEGDLRYHKTIEQLSKIEMDILVNNAGMYLNKSVLEMTIEESEDVMAVNFLAPVWLTTKVFEQFKNKGHGIVVNINSIAVTNPKEGEALYSASKHALKGFMKSFEYEALKSNVCIMNFYLGALETELCTGYRDVHNNCIDVNEIAEFIVSSVQSHKYSTMRVPDIQILRKRY